ncbi:MAG TPA: MbcA/ParS/Xre antitoxin family protein [Myxococcaceae bacterium]|nr:MbcA/ParS/Xre antitoxin family protein [Myxococcaceae bacterium]
MARNAPASVPALDPGVVLSRALLRAATALGLNGQTMARVVGVSAASWSRLASGQRTVDPDGKEGELALLFLRLYRSLDALVGGDAEKARAWLRAPNMHLSAVPLECVQSVTGLVRVDEYLDAVRGKT